MKVLSLGLLLILLSLTGKSQNQSNADLFWKELQKHCGKAYRGTVTETPESGTFKEKVLVMHVRTCSDSLIKIPFVVGDDRSRTWVLTRIEGRIQLKHDHRHEDGSQDKVTQYGGLATNEGSASLQIFPADTETAKLLPNAASNVWWMSLQDKIFTYNLRRLNSDRLVTVSFDLSQESSIPAAPWGSQ